MTQQIDLMNQVRGYYIGTKASIEALTGIPEGSIGYATDTNEFGFYNGSSWTWGAGGGVTDHGALTGLSDDDHSQYHNDARGDARYAPIAKGVTNGDSHDHSGGDGAQIAYGALFGLPTLFTAEDAQDAVGAMIDSTLIYTDGAPLLQRAGILGDVIIAAGSNSAEINNDDLIAIMGLSPTNDDILQRKAGAWTNRTLAQLLADFPIAFGTWTPVATNGTNVAASTPGVWNYIRVSNQVSFHGVLQVDTTAIGAFDLLLTLPIASAFDSGNDASGNGTHPGTGTPSIISIREDQASDKLRLDGYAQSAANTFYRCAGGYIIKQGAA